MPAKGLKSRGSVNLSEMRVPMGNKRKPTEKPLLVVRIKRVCLARWGRIKWVSVP